LKAQSARARPTPNRTQPQTSTILRGRWLTIARVAWTTATLLAVTLFTVSLPAFYDNFRTLYGDEEHRVLRANLDELGLSIDTYAWYLFALGVVVAVAFFALAVVIFYRKSNDLMALFTAMMLILTGATIWGTADILATIHPTLGFLGNVLFVLSLASLFLFLYLFPDGRFVPRWTFWLAIVLGVVMVPIALFPVPPFDMRKWSPLAFALFLLFWVLPGVIAQIYRYRRVSSPMQRQQTKWVVFGLSAALTGLVGVIILLATVPSLKPGSVAADFIGATATAGFALLIPLSLTIAILWHHLYDIDILINRTLVYGVLTAMLVVVYFGGVAASQATFHTLTGQERQPQLAIVISTLVIAALFNPLRRRIQSFTDRRFYRKKYDARKTLEAFSAKIRDETDLDALSDDLVGVVKETMQPAHVSLWLRPDTPPKGEQADQ
jgi:hypothetical protein